MIMVMAADHGGYELKNAIKKHLQERGGFQILDLGTNDGEAVDYPEYGKACGDAVASGKADLGIVCCGSGVGISMAANKAKGARCALCYSEEIARLAKEHNNANILAGGRMTAPEEACKMVDIWLDTEWAGLTQERHARRVAQLDAL